MAKQIKNENECKKKTYKVKERSAKDKKNSMEIEDYFVAGCNVNYD